MNPQWLLGDDLAFRLLALACVLVPALLILRSRRSSWWSKLLWAGATQLPWLFLWAYRLIGQARYAQDAAPPLAGALGWWILAFPWAVYLLYRATRRRFAGEARPPR